MSAPLDPASVNLAIETGGVAFRNPVLTASGTFGYGREFEGLTDLRALGGLVTKGISPAPRFGNATPRICETASGMLNSIGLENVGVEGFERDKLPYLRQCGTRVLVNFFGATFDEYVACGAGLDRLDGVDALEMNVSCPNIKAGGIEFGTDPRVLADLVRACRAVIKKPLWIKLTPNTSDIVALARACADGGADGLSIINTITGMAIDARTRRPEDRDDLRRAVGAGDQADRAAHGLPGPPRAACRCRSRASAASRTRPTRSSSSSPARPPCRSGRRASSTPTPRGTSCAICRRGWPPTASATCAS